MELAARPEPEPLSLRSEWKRAKPKSAKTARTTLPGLFLRHPVAVKHWRISRHGGPQLNRPASAEWNAVDGEPRGEMASDQHHLIHVWFEFAVFCLATEKTVENSVGEFKDKRDSNRCFTITRFVIHAKTEQSNNIAVLDSSKDFNFSLNHLGERSSLDDCAATPRIFLTSMPSFFEDLTEFFTPNRLLIVVGYLFNATTVDNDSSGWGITLLNWTCRRSISFRILEETQDEVEGFFLGTHKVRLLAPVEIAADIDLSMTTCWLLIPLGGTACLALASSKLIYNFWIFFCSSSIRFWSSNWETLSFESKRSTGSGWLIWEGSETGTGT
jgi:hypothetical protein